MFSIACISFEWNFQLFQEILGQNDWIIIFPFLNYWSLQCANLSDEMEGFFFNRLENDPVDVDLSSGGISQADVSRYLMSTLHQVLASQGARSNRRNDYHLYIGWYWVTKLFFFTQTKQTPRLNWRLLNFATELSNLTLSAILGLRWECLISSWANG